MVFLEPKKWLSWLPLAEWWYNTNYHTSLKSIPFEALYGYPPPMISKVMIPGHPSSSIDFLAPKQEMLLKLKANLAQAQGRIKKYADLNRTERSFNPSVIAHFSFWKRLDWQLINFNFLTLLIYTQFFMSVS
jgi:hypothetical protein